MWSFRIYCSREAARETGNALANLVSLETVFAAIDAQTRRGLIFPPRRKA